MGSLTLASRQLVSQSSDGQPTVTLMTQVIVTLATAWVTTTLFVYMELRAPDPDNSLGHQGGNVAIVTGSILAALLYTPVLAFFVWDFSWWLAILVTPSAFVTGTAGFVLALPLLTVVERVFSNHGDN